MPSHTPGKRLTEGRRVVDRQSVERAGCSVPNDTDQPPVYGSEEALWPVESRQTYGGKRVVGVCESCCYSVVVEDRHGFGRPACVLCGVEVTTR